MAGRQKEEAREGFGANASEVKARDSLRSHWKFPARARMQTIDCLIVEMRCKFVT